MSRRRPAARPLRRNALGRKLSCCLQDRAGAAFGPERANVGDSARRQRGAARGTGASRPGCGSALSADCPGILADSPPRFSGGGNRRGDGVGSRARCIPTASVDTSMVGRTAHSSGNAVGPYGVVASAADGFSGRGDLETAIECVPHPGREGAGGTAASEGGGGCYFIRSPARSGYWHSATTLAIGRPRDSTRPRFDYNTGGIAVILNRRQHISTTESTAPSSVRAFHRSTM